MIKKYVIFLLIFCFSCSIGKNEDNNILNKVSVKNSSLSDLIFLVVDGATVSNISNLSDVNDLCLCSINIPSESEGETHLENGNYAFFYSYGSFFGPLTEEFSIKIFEISKTDLSLEISKKGWNAR